MREHRFADRMKRNPAQRRSMHSRKSREFGQRGRAVRTRDRRCELEQFLRAALQHAQPNRILRFDHDFMDKSRIGGVDRFGQ